MFSKDGKHHKCYLDCIEDVGWHVSHHHHNGTERWGVNLPNLVETFQSFVDDGSLIPEWQKPSTWMLGKASHVSASSLTQPAPSSLKKALLHDNPDRNIWLDSCKEEKQGLDDHNTCEVISATQCYNLSKEKGIKAIPSMCVFTIKKDEFNNPIRAKS